MKNLYALLLTCFMGSSAAGTARSHVSPSHTVAATHARRGEM